ncbi:hypothetical protein SGLAM104S_03631 [Streptomyces glaucescens]
MSGNIRLLTDTLAAAKAEGRAALIAYLPAGFPTVDGGIDAIKAVLDGGAGASSRSVCRTATRSWTARSSRPPTTSPCAAA